MYHIYTTEALVCGSFLHGTADKVFLLFTKDLGMLYATAKSVREERSKQRFALQEFSLIKVSLIRGKQGWWVGSVEPERNYFQEAINREARGSVVLIFKTIRRFIHGEESLLQIFNFCLNILDKLVKEIEFRKYADLILQVKILDELGYIDDKDLPNHFKIMNLQNLFNLQEQLSTDELQLLIKKAVENSHL